MIDRILHIGHRFSSQYNKELLQRAAEVYLNNGYTAVTPHLVDVEKLPPAEAAALAQKINKEMISVNRQVLLLYVVMFCIFAFIAYVSFRVYSFVFGAFFAIPALFILRSMIKFIRRNKLQ
jgi:hypothetical protein